MKLKDMPVSDKAKHYLDETIEELKDWQAEDVRAMYNVDELRAVELSGITKMINNFIKENKKESELQWYNGGTDE